MPLFQPRSAIGINYNAFKAIVPQDFVPVALQGTAKHAAALFIGVGGDISLVGTDGTAVVFKNVPSGALLPIHAITVNATGTTASAIVALFRV